MLSMVLKSWPLTASPNFPWVYCAIYYTCQLAIKGKGRLCMLEYIFNKHSHTWCHPGSNTTYLNGIMQAGGSQLFWLDINTKDTFKLQKNLLGFNCTTLVSRSHFTYHRLCYAFILTGFHSSNTDQYLMWHYRALRTFQHLLDYVYDNFMAVMLHLQMCHMCITYSVDLVKPSHT